MLHINDPEAVKEKRAVATFAFDNTMTVPAFNTHLMRWQLSVSPNEHIVDEMFRLTCERWKVIVIASRPETLGDKAAVRGFLTRHEIPTNGIMFTYDNDKIDFIERAESILHFDSDMSVIARLPQGVRGVRVRQPSALTGDELLSFLSKALDY